MQSNLIDIYNAQPEQLGQFDTFINYTSTGLIAGNINFPIDTNRVYIIQRIKTCISVFRNNTGSVIAFPNFEQFQLPLDFKGEVVNAQYNQTKILFNEMRDVYTDGSMHAHTFESPFVVAADQKQGNQIRVNITCNDSLTNTVGSLSTGIPTAPIAYFARGLMVLEGFSLGISEYNLLKEQLKI
jgi:hypothetical protein